MPLDKLCEIKHAVEAEIAIHLTEDDFADGRAEIEHIYFHEACHAAVAHCVPWVHTLNEKEHTALDELMARFLEVEIGKNTGMFVHKRQQNSLKSCGDIRWRSLAEAFEHLTDVWENHFWPMKDLAGMAAYTLAFLQHGEAIYHILPKEGLGKGASAGFV